MNKLTPLFATVALLACASAWAEAPATADLTYCLELKSNVDIAKCAGETTTRNKGKPMSQAEMEKLLQKEEAAVPAEKSAPAAKPAVEVPTTDTTPKY